MHHLILGYGYCGYYLAQELLKHDQQVTALSRHLNPELQQPGLSHVTHDLNQPFNWTESNTIVYYLIPPQPQGERDIFLRQFLSHNRVNARKVIYFGSSAVYGNHQGNWVNEQSTCVINNARQLRRLDAEQQWLSYCNQNSIQAVLLRVAGIYGPQRLPIEAAKAQTPIIEKDKAPYTNHIYVRDLAAISYLLAQCPTPHTLYNIADGAPQPMGTIQKKVAKALGIKPAPYESWEQAWERASPMKREFMQGSKRLQIDRLKQSLKSSLSLSHLNDAIQQSLSI
ncbi:SDR family oxidoreductase [Legionella maioricensis]|uniref:SDR family oxidoreductase n=1 Tax=Legionella maioricensis TaxID=2896528 RepID=A0A9X2D1H3_9GAMM|nr:SDR family oxidoreductase [Legionella maioricensis]MCL9684673.1 SDR family oxidoreductase [Legionella maioricensis]MCL9687701.1 SDR family oxidoreductase [Legionella maioricensis]